MKKLEPITFDFAQCRRQIEDLRAWLKAKDELEEKNDILPFFRDHPQIATLLGTLNPSIALVDRIAWEFDIFGDFACDLVVGNWAKGAYTFVEFEDAKKSSIFRKQGEKATREWGTRFDHGCSQIIDWAYKLDSLSRSHDILARFGVHEITYEMILVIGRADHLDKGEKHRLKWRGNNVSVQNNKIMCMTFDNLLDELSERLVMFSAVESTLVAAAASESGAGSSLPSTT